MEDIEWNITNEGYLLEAMVGHKPLGVNKHFQMAFICYKFADFINREVHSDKIWEHLRTMYNLEILDNNEGLPFPNVEKEFSLPEEYNILMNIKKDEDKKSQTKTKDNLKTPKDVKKEDKTSGKTSKDVSRRDSKDSKETKLQTSTKKDMKKDMEKTKGKGKHSGSLKHDVGNGKKSDETPKQTKRPTRGSLKPDDINISGKSSPVPTSSVKRRRL